MQIWIYLNGVQQGPYTLQQLKVMGLDPTTPVWYDGLAQWLPAAQAPETMSLFGISPTPEPSSTAYNAPKDTPAKPSTYLVWNIILTVLCCCPLALIGIITGAISSSRFTSGDYAGAKRMSTLTEWLLILSIVWILLSIPFMLIFNLI